MLGSSPAYKRALGRGHPRGLPRIDRKRRAKRARNPLEAGFGDVMAVQAVQRLDMQRQAAVHRERLEELAHQFRVERADLRRGELRAEHQERPARNVERDAGQRLVHRQQAIGVAGQAALVAERLLERLPERDADILDGVVVVDMQIALGGNADIDERVARELVEHMVEEADAGGDLGRAGAVEVELDRDLRLVGLAGHRPLAHVASGLAQILGSA